jgi:hypothetical protein
VRLAWNNGSSGNRPWQPPRRHPTLSQAIVVPGQIMMQSTPAIELADAPLDLALLMERH